MLASKKDDISLTPNAIERILALIEEEKKPLLLRITVNGGGCSGFEYNFSVDSAVQDDDLVFGDDKAKVAVDGVSYSLLKGSTVDYVEDLVGSSFVIKNPNASSACGCGNSFTI